MAGFGAFDLSKITSIVDKTLGIDGTQAEQAMEASMDEGNFLTVVAGKEANDKIAATSEKAAKQLGQVVEKVKTAPLKVPLSDKKEKKAEGSKTSKSDDFFSTFDLDNQFKSSGTPSKAKEETRSVSTPKTKKEPVGGGEVEVKTAEPASTIVEDGWEDDWGTPAKVVKGPKDKGSASKPATSPKPGTSKLAAAPNPAPPSKEGSMHGTSEKETTDPAPAAEKPSAVEEPKPAVPDKAPEVAPLEEAKHSKLDQGAGKVEDAVHQKKVMSPAKNQHKEAAESELTSGASRSSQSSETEDSSEWKKKFFDLKARNDVSAREIEQLQDALAKKGTQLFESVSKQEELAVELEKKKAECQKLAGETEQFKEEKEKMRKMKTELTEAQKAREELMAEGEKLMKKKQDQEDTIKVLRKQLKAKDQGNKTLEDQREAEEAKMKGYEERLSEANKASQIKDQKIKELVNEKQELKKAAEKAEKEAASLQQKLTSLDKKFESVRERKEMLEKQLGEASAEAQDDARRVLEKERKVYEKEAQGQIETLTDTIESMQTAMRRLETQSSSKEQRLREEMEDLQRRCREAEERSQELSSAVPEATRPLLRQIESLQASFAEKQKVWEKVEAGLRQRAADAEGEARQAAESERISKERFSQNQDEVGLMEAKINTLQSEVSRLGAELRGSKEEYETAATRERDALAELEVVKSTAEKRNSEISELKTVNRRLVSETEMQLSEEKERAADEKLEMQKHIKSLEYQVQNLKSSTNQAVREVSENSGSEMFNINKFQSSAIDLQGSGAQGDIFKSFVPDSPARNGSIFFDPAASKQHESQIHSLQQRLVALENERDSLADELAYTVTMSQRATADAAALPSVQSELGYLQRQQELTLELLGAKEEELDDMRLTLEEIRLIYRAEMEKLMEFVPSTTQWNPQTFPSSSRPGGRHKDLGNEDREFKQDL